MTKVVEPMTSGTIWKRLTFFALPLFLGNLFQQLYNTVDSLIVGNFLGSSALAAVSSSGSLIFMLIGFLSGIAGGAGVVVARLFGAEDNEGVQRAVHTTVAFGLVAGVAMTALGVLLSPQILIWMDTPESVLPQSITYLRIYFAGSLFFVMYNIFGRIRPGHPTTSYPGVAQLVARLLWENTPGPPHNFISGCSAAGSAPALGEYARATPQLHIRV